MLHLLAFGAYHILNAADEFSATLPFALAIMAAILIDEFVRHSSYRWLPTEEQLKPSCFGEVIFPMLFDGSSDFFSAFSLFLGLTIQYLLTGLAIGTHHHHL